MSVVLVHDCVLTVHVPGTHCSFCDRKLFPPYVAWSAKSEIYICGACCRSLRTGLVADIIQVVAIEELQELYPGYTLARSLTTQVEKAERQELDKYGLEGGKHHD